MPITVNHTFHPYICGHKDSIVQENKYITKLTMYAYYL